MERRESKGRRKEGEGKEGREGEGKEGREGGRKEKGRNEVKGGEGEG